MVTITAPGVEINELDLSFYDFPAPKEETQNVLVTGFSTKGHNNVPYTFTNKNSDSDLLNTFGTPTNEAERYFFNACSEVIKRKKTVLYAARLPYDNTQGTTFNAVQYTLGNAIEIDAETTDISEVVSADGSLIGKQYMPISKSEQISISDIDIENYRTGVKRATAGKFIIIDKNQEIYDKIPADAKHMTLDSRYLLGVLPIVTTATNALYYQKLIKAVDDGTDANIKKYETTNALTSNGQEYSTISSLLIYPASSNDLDPDNQGAMTLSKYSAGFFPTINIQPDGTFDSNILKQIGIVVFRGYVDTESGNKIKYEPIEAYAGSLKNDDVDAVTGKSTFIDDIVNTNSKTIELYSNCFNGSVEGSKTLSVAQFELVDNNCSFYTGISETDPTNVGKSGYDKVLSNLIINGETVKYTAKVGDIVSYTNTTVTPNVSAYYVLDKKEDSTGTKADKETWKKIDGTYVTVVFNREPIVNKRVDINEKDSEGKPLVNFMPEKQDMLKYPGSGTTVKFYVCSYAGEEKEKADFSNIALLHAKDLNSYVLGFKEVDAEDKKINCSVIMRSLDKIFEKNKDRDEKQIDIVVDAGVSNIAQFNKSVNKQEQWLNAYDPVAWESDTKNAALLWDVCNRITDTGHKGEPARYTDTWALVLKKYDDFCKLRGDCMFIADGLRPLCICGNRKRVTKTNFNSTVPKTISPFMKYITGKIDTSYGCGNCDWYQIVDPTSGVNIWMPPSVKMMCSMLDTTNNKFYWTVPVGVNNGKMNPVYGSEELNPSVVKVIDVAFSPTTKDAGDIYTKSWNYAKYYEDDGFVLEGQRTFQTRPTAFDRINVRRLFLYLERKTYNAAKYFIYEGNTAYTRQRLVDAITPFFEDAKINEGLYDYRIQCDDKNNTPDTIDRNELHVKIAIKPTKAIEFIECTFVALRTGASFTEAGMND